MNTASYLNSLSNQLQNALSDLGVNSSNLTDIKTNTGNTKTSVDAVTTKLNTVFGNTARDLGSGNIGSNTQRVCIASNDVLMSDIKTNTYNAAFYANNTGNNTGTTAGYTGDIRLQMIDYRLLSNIIVDKYTDKWCWWGSYYFPGNGVTGALFDQIAGSNTGGSLYAQYCIRFRKHNNTNIDLNVVLNKDQSSANLAPPYDNMKIISTDTTGDDYTAGTYARSVLFKYYDNNNVIQTVTHNLNVDAAVTYNVREILKFEVSSWGTYKWNSGPIYLYTGSTIYSAFIHGFSNLWTPMFITIPYNGFALLQRLHVEIQGSSTYNGHFAVKIFLIKQTSSTIANNIIQVIWYNYCNGGLCHDFDLSHFPKIDGPTNNSEHWALCVAMANDAAYQIYHTSRLFAKVYRP